MSKCDTCIIKQKAKELDGVCIWYMDNVVCGNETIKDCPNYKNKED